MVNLVTRYNRLPDMSRADVDLLAGDIANFIRYELANIDDSGFGELKRYTSGTCTLVLFLCNSMSPPHWDRVTNKYFNKDDFAPAVIRMFTESWWRSRLRRVASAWREHLQIAVGKVFVRNELIPLQDRMSEVNAWAGQEVIRFKSYTLDTEID